MSLATYSLKFDIDKIVSQHKLSFLTIFVFKHVIFVLVALLWVWFVLEGWVDHDHYLFVQRKLLIFTSVAKMRSSKLKIKHHNSITFADHWSTNAIKDTWITIRFKNLKHLRNSYLMISADRKIDRFTFTLQFWVIDFDDTFDALL